MVIVMHIHIDRWQCVVYIFTGSITSARMTSSADTKAELGSKENPITEDDAPPTAAEEGDATEVVPAVESGPNERMSGAVIGGVVEMAKFHIQNLINLMKALLNVNRKIGIGLKNKTPVNSTLAMELHCSAVRHT
jgi:hypothetical protein